jgi:hypothetical protein
VFEKEPLKETGVRPGRPPVLRSAHLKRQASPRDHVPLCLVEGYEIAAERGPSREIAEIARFPLGHLPWTTSASTRRRIEEIVGGTVIGPDG